MSNFPQKKFEGMLYGFEHLAPMQEKVALNSQNTTFIDMRVTFGCHCFTEEFDPLRHQDHHRYTHRGELRAFDLLRYQCSLQLPQIMKVIQRGTIYNAEESYTYAAHITLPSHFGRRQSYSIFFSLEKDKNLRTPGVKIFVKSAYLKPSVAKPNAQSWRFVSLAGQVSGAFAPSVKKGKPTKKKKKAPQGLSLAS